jgi:hypothetical protein
MHINIWTARKSVAFKIIVFFLYIYVTNFVLIYISYICIYVILIFFLFILKDDERGE